MAIIIAARELSPGDIIDQAVVDSIAYSESILFGGKEGLKAALVVKLKDGRTVELHPSWPVHVKRQT